MGQLKDPPPSGGPVAEAGCSVPDGGSTGGSLMLVLVIVVIRWLPTLVLVIP